MTADKLVVIAGACTRGTIAYGIAYAFASAGWNVAVVGRHMKRTTQAAREITAATNARIEPFVFDATRESGDEDSARLAAAVAEKMGTASVLVNASQAAKVGDKLEKTKLADLRTALDTGVVEAYLLMRAFYPQLKESKGLVVNLLSAGAASGQPGMSLLAASKEGMRGLSRVVANEWHAEGVRVVCLEPQVKTSAFAKWAAEYPDAASELEGDLESVEAFSSRIVGLCS